MRSSLSPSWHTRQLAWTSRILEEITHRFKKLLQTPVLMLSYHVTCRVGHFIGISENAVRSYRNHFQTKGYFSPIKDFLSGRFPRRRPPPLQRLFELASRWLAWCIRNKVLTGLCAGSAHLVSVAHCSGL